MSLDSLSVSSSEGMFENDSDSIDIDNDSIDNGFNSSVSIDPQSLRCLRENNSTDNFEGELKFYFLWFNLGEVW